MRGKRPGTGLEPLLLGEPGQLALELPHVRLQVRSHRAVVGSRGRRDPVQGVPHGFAEFLQ